MPKTSVKTFLQLIHKLNEGMDMIAGEGGDLLNRINDIDFTSVTDPLKEEELTIEVNELEKKFLKLNVLKETLMDGLQRRVIQEMDATPYHTRIRSVTVGRRSKSIKGSPRKTRSATPRLNTV